MIMTQIEIDIGFLAKAKKRVWVKPTAQKKGHYREVEVGGKPGVGERPKPKRSAESLERERLHNEKMKRMKEETAKLREKTKKIKGKTQAEIKEIRRKSTEDSPEVKELRAKIAETESKIKGTNKETRRQKKLYRQMLAEED